jgi:hypothetical protein
MPFLLYIYFKCVNIKILNPHKFKSCRLLCEHSWLLFLSCDSRIWIGEDEASPIVLVIVWQSHINKIVRHASLQTRWLNRVRVTVALPEARMGQTCQFWHYWTVTNAIGPIRLRVALVMQLLIVTYLYWVYRRYADQLARGYTTIGILAFSKLKFIIKLGLLIWKGFNYRKY